MLVRRKQSSASCGRADDRLVLVERGVEHHRHAGQFAEGLDQSLVARVGAAGDGLQPARAVDMGHGGNGGRFSSRI